jgi:hypothetical protein
MKRTGSAAFLAILGLLVLAAPAAAEFSITEFSASTTGTQAGAHPDVTTRLVIPTGAEGGGEVRDLAVRLPPGLQGAPDAVARCSHASFTLRACPADTQVGWVEATFGPAFGGVTLGFSVFNVEPSSDDLAAELGFFLGQVAMHLAIKVRGDGDNGLTVEDVGISRFPPVKAVELTIWGVPGDPSHDSQRLDATGKPVTPGPLPEVPYFTNPTSCGGELRLHAEANSYQEPDEAVSAETTLPPIGGCGELEFAPTLRARPTTDVTDSPSGFDLDLEVPQNLDPDGLASAQPRDAILTLPEGLVVNPSGADGLEACSPERACPAASSLGSVELDTPAFSEPLEGEVYLAQPHRNPFGSLLAVYVSIRGPGLDIKLPAEIEADHRTGRIKIKLREIPQLPVEHLRVHLFKGALAPLRTPAVCGTYATTSTLTPWSAPDSGPPATPSTRYAIGRAPGGGSCPTSEAELPSSPSFKAGSTAPLAGAFRPFVVNLRREDGTGPFGSFTVSPPPGLLAKLAGVESCPDLSLALAAGRPGRDEEASPSCPAASRVGRVVVRAGAGPEPYAAAGTVYLAGSYQGAPLSLAIVVPAVAGPFDLGTVVARVALHVDPGTAQVTAESDPIPTILHGIPLDVRSVAIGLDRPEFTLNPTSCDPSSVDGALTSSGAVAALRSRFQVGDCSRLAFRPRLALDVLSGTARNAHPAFRAVLRSAGRAANVAAATISLPPGELLDLRHLPALCPSDLPPARCPRASRLGRAQIWTPLLDAPLQGPIYLRRPTGRYPGLLADLRGPYGLGFALRGAFDAASAGRVSIRLSNLPDVPIEKAVFTLAGGRRGVLVNSRSLCGHPGRGLAVLVAHDSRLGSLRPRLRLGDRC